MDLPSEQIPLIETFRYHIESHKKIFLTALTAFILVLPVCLSAQDGNGSNSRLDRLRGGNLGMKIQWSGESFSGLGSRADAMGGSIGTLYPGPDAISFNPAGLGFARGFQVTLDWAPPLTLNPAGIFGIENRINESLIIVSENNNPPRDPNTGELRPDQVVKDADVTSELDMRGGLKGGAIMYGTPYFTIAGSFHQPLRFETQINISGAEFLAAALDDDGKETNLIFATVNGNFNLNLNIETSSIAIATERLLPNLSLGMVYDNFNAEMNFASTFLPEGIISSTGGDTRFFNDPAKIQYDSLFAEIKGDWEGNGIRLRWGLGYHPIPNISVDAVVALPAKIDLRGPFSMVHNEIRALDLRAGENEEVFDIDILVEDNLTKTKKINTRIPGIDIEMPGSATFGLSARWDKNYVASLVYAKYFDHLAYRMQYSQFDSLNNPEEFGEIHQGIELGSSYRIGIGVEPLIIGLGLVLGDTFSETTTNGDAPKISRNRIFVPVFSLGGGVKIGPRFRLDYVLSLLNSSFLRFSTSYAFN
ncbi:MAG: hypothetical protein ACE5IR_12930 [bacterium]